MRSYTDIEQSKKLAEMLSVDSADMYWINALNRDKRFHSPYPHFRERLRPEVNGKFIPRYELGKRDVPCWSIAALLDILRNRAYSIDKDANVSLSSYKTVEWDLSIINSGLEAVTNSDPIDACVEMILKLKEKDLL